MDKTNPTESSPPAKAIISVYSFNQLPESAQEFVRSYDGDEGDEALYSLSGEYMDEYVERFVDPGLLNAAADLQGACEKLVEAMALCTCADCYDRETVMLGERAIANAKAVNAGTDTDGGPKRSAPRN